MMKTSHRQASHAKRRWQADPSSIYRVMNKLQPFTDAEQHRLTNPVKLAYEKLRTGAATEPDFHVLAASINVTMILAERIDPLAEKVAVDERCVKCRDKDWMGGPCSVSDAEYAAAQPVREPAQPEQEIAQNLLNAWTAHTGAEPSESVLGRAIDEAAAALQSAQPVRELRFEWTVFNGAGAAVIENITRESALEHLSEERIARGWNAVGCEVIDTVEKFRTQPVLEPALPRKEMFMLGGCPFCGSQSCVAGSCRTQPAQPESETDSMGIPKSCGKPLCTPQNHHPLCRLYAAQPAQPVREPSQVKVVEQSAILARGRFHFFKGEDGEPDDWEWFEEGTNCDSGCIDAVIVRADALAAGRAALAGEQAKAPLTDEIDWAAVGRIIEMNDRVRGTLVSGTSNWGAAIYRAAHGIGTGGAQ